MDPQNIITVSTTNRGINTQKFRNAAINTKHPSIYGINSSLSILHISWVTRIGVLLQINFLNKNLTVTELRCPLPTSCGPSTFSQEGVHWYMQNYFRRSSLEESLKNTVINYRNVMQQLLKAIPLHRKTKWRNIWNFSDKTPGNECSHSYLSATADDAPATTGENAGKLCRFPTHFSYTFIHQQSLDVQKWSTRYVWWPLCKN